MQQVPLNTKYAFLRVKLYNDLYSVKERPFIFLSFTPLGAKTRMMPYARRAVRLIIYTSILILYAQRKCNSFDKYDSTRDACARVLDDDGCRVYYNVGVSSGTSVFNRVYTINIVTHLHIIIVRTHAHARARTYMRVNKY